MQLKLARLEKLQAEEIHLNSTLGSMRSNDPAEVKNVEESAAANKIAGDRWTDNIWSLKNYLTKKKGLSGKEV